MLNAEEEMLNTVAKKDIFCLAKKKKIKHAITETVEHMQLHTWFLLYNV